MTTLRAFPRDVELPARAGDTALRPLKPDEALALARRSLVRAGGPELTGVTWAHVRWVPRTSSLALYDVQADDGRVLRLALEIRSRELSPAGRRSVARTLRDPRLAELLPGLMPAVELDAGRFAWWYPADRGLPGARRSADLSRTRRLLAPAFPGFDVRGRRSTLELLRYKPGQRAVMRLDLALRSSIGERSTRTLAVRVLPPRKLARALTARTSAGPDAPRIVAVQERSGLLYEDWVEGSAVERDDFSIARDLGALLAPLHARSTTAPTTEPDDARLLEWFAFDGDLWSCARELIEQPLPIPPRPAWIHADVHADQVVRRPDGGLALLDWDALRPGDPAEDVASLWCDAISAGTDADDVLGNMLAGYATAGGPRPAHAALLAHVRRGLVRRAASAIRRLESGALGEAMRLLTLAREAVR